MDCPLCFSTAGPGFSLTLEEVETMLDDFVRTEGVPEVVQFSGGEPTIHPQINFQPAFHAGRHLGHDPMQRITIPDILRLIEEQTTGKFVVSDFIPVPCCFPTCNAVTYAFVDGDKVTPLPRIVNVYEYLDYITKCCKEFLLPGGKQIPFCAYNTIGYREQARAQLEAMEPERRRAREEGRRFEPRPVTFSLESVVLDAASGKGTSAMLIAQRFGSAVVGVDLSVQNVAHANTEADLEGIHLVAANRMTRQALVAVSERRLGYALMCAAKPKESVGQING
jgi:hypothetical protein